ncbi:hydrogenase nickel incorporation protein HypA [Vibrio sp. qd031]|uniref:hydrogenase maturation nickel metallochaperone HypA/HybF n=1 Tax=Vibrio sp. qd031 TaxID=1603038 RepID=UPI000A120764|nr:hydrogenase maturation nickel metallochaperone HypA [Vibrio sp. qd031]ORT52860.1 hydrogenase nickel incorporation protein HypA [Vibrio sp. qd031]
MHELGVVIEVVNTVQRFAKKHQVTHVDTIVLQIGELSSMIPKYVETCYPAAVDGTSLEKTKLEIEIIAAIGLCHHCGESFEILKHRSTCPSCEQNKWGLLSGKEFMVKEIIAH